VGLVFFISAAGLDHFVWNKMGQPKAARRAKHRDDVHGEGETSYWSRSWPGPCTSVARGHGALTYRRQVGYSLGINWIYLVPKAGQTYRN